MRNHVVRSSHVCISPKAELHYGDISRWRCHSLQLPDSTPGRESISALYKIIYKGVTHIRLCVFLSNWKASSFQGLVIPT